MTVTQTILPSKIHEHLLCAMGVYRFLSPEQRDVIVRFTQNFCQNTEMLVSPNVAAGPELGWVVGANAALVGGAQKTNCFSCVKWVYFDTYKELPDFDGFTAGVTSVRLNANACIDETKNITPGSNVIVHEFAHVLDNLYGITGSCDILNNAYKQNKQLSAESGIHTINDVAVIDHQNTLIPHNHRQGSEQEFFAYSTEYFFTSPHDLAASYPDLYQRYVSIYGLDMAEILPARK